MGVNAAGLQSKITSFKNVLEDLKPSLFFVQETKYSTKGRLNFDKNFKVYELLRKNRSGGGLALGCHKSLQPAWANEGDDMMEFLSIYIHLKNIKIGCCMAYGP